LIIIVIQKEAFGLIDEHKDFFYLNAHFEASDVMNFINEENEKKIIENSMNIEGRTVNFFEK